MPKNEFEIVSSIEVIAFCHICCLILIYSTVFLFLFSMCDTSRSAMSRCWILKMENLLWTSYQEKTKYITIQNGIFYSVRNEAFYSVTMKLYFKAMTSQGIKR